MGAPFSKPQKPLPLQKLPRDVRLMIYEEVFDREAFICYVRLQWRERCRTTCDATNSWLHMASCTGIFTTWSYVSDLSVGDLSVGCLERDGRG